MHFSERKDDDNDDDVGAKRAESRRFLESLFS